jgi:hypothetical protein
MLATGNRYSYSSWTFFDAVYSLFRHAGNEKLGIPACRFGDK